MWRESARDKKKADKAEASPPFLVSLLVLSPGCLRFVLVRVDNVDEPEHVVVERMHPVHTDHEKTAGLRELDLDSISRRSDCGRRDGRRRSGKETASARETGGIDRGHGTLTDRRSSRSRQQPLTV